MKIALLQVNATVGDLDGNLKRVWDAYKKAVEQGAELCFSPELVLSGYPPRDLLLYGDFLSLHAKACQDLASQTVGVPLIFGAFAENQKRPGKPLYNSAYVAVEGGVKTIVHKSLLPTYDVFDEDRYFEPAVSTEPVELLGKKLGITICEDIWNDEEFWPERLYGHDPVPHLIEQGAEIILNLSASPWHVGKEVTRASILSRIAKRHGVPVLQVNMVGGNDELVFDGQSVACNAKGEIVAMGRGFDSDLLIVDPSEAPALENKWPCYEQQIFGALALGVRDYVQKCGFDTVVLGLSGGIDSALTAAVAVEALGPDRVMGVLMPSKFSSEGSVKDAEQLANVLEIETKTIRIEESVVAFLGQMEPHFDGKEPDLTEENIQARLRGLTLMALSNKFNRLVLTTGNKSELAVGYCTLYGDMCGALAVISDVPKTWVYRICRWLNHNTEIIPNNTIEKPPSAELREDQTDQDSLPPYDMIDDVLDGFVVEHLSVEEICERGGHDPEEVRRLVRMIDITEYKRRQAAPGLRVTSKAFGMGRRMPVAQRFRHV